MRVKAVLRDTDILQMEAGSKNVVSWSSLLKVMGLTVEDRTAMLEMLKDTKFHIWLANEGDQDLIFLSESETESPDEPAYRWQ